MAPGAGGGQPHPEPLNPWDGGTRGQSLGQRRASSQHPGRTPAVTSGPETGRLHGVSFPTDSLPRGIFSGRPGCQARADENRRQQPLLQSRSSTQAPLGWASPGKAGTWLEAALPPLAVRPQGPWGPINTGQCLPERRQGGAAAPPRQSLLEPLRSGLGIAAGCCPGPGGFHSSTWVGQCPAFWKRLPVPGSACRLPLQEVGAGWRWHRALCPS